MKKLLIIAPHLSTGGMPQYLVKQIEHFIKDFDIYCIEYDNITGGVLVVQRNRIQDMLGNKLITLGDDKSSIINIIDDINPDIIHFQEIPETFINDDLLKIIYREERDYFILVTTHSSYTDPKNIRFTADKFVLVSNWSKNKFVDHFGEDLCDIWEYPIDIKYYNKELVKNELSFDLDKKHILHVGLFTPGKNQKEIIELARLCKDNNFVFHFVGNQAENFRDYWEPLMIDFPDNCIWHGERDDVDKFYMASDLFYFPSLFELNPISIKEAIGYNLPIMLRNLPTYNSEYDNLNHISIDQYDNRNKIMDIFKVDDFVSIYNNLEKNNDILQKIDPKFVINFINGPYLEVRNSIGYNFNVSFIDKKTGECHYNTNITNNCWTRSDISYFVDWKILIKRDDGENFELDFNPSNKRVFIAIESKSIGDTIAWFASIEEFRKKWNCSVICSTFHNYLFSDQYPDLEFVSPGSVVNGIYAMYKLGLFFNEDDDINYKLHKNDPKKMSLIGISSDILGLDYNELRPKLRNSDVEKKKRVGIGFHSTAQTKYWNNPNGWQEVTDYLISNGYEVLVLSKEEDGYMGNFYPQGVTKLPEGTIDDLIDEISSCEFFIGISSGLSWLAWAINIPVVLISGFTGEELEPSNNVVRIINKDVCNNCWSRHKFNPGDWNWCPDQKGTTWEFICTKSITGKMVIDEIINNDLIKSDSLCEIMKRCGSDKGLSKHNYTILYYEFFKSFINEEINLFEMGVGTNNIEIISNMGADGKPGASLRGWKEFFKKGNIYGADIDPDIIFEDDRIKTFVCDQTNPLSIKNMWESDNLNNKMFDIIIDDGLHEFGSNLTFFENSVHKLKRNGYYIIEDLLPYCVEEFERIIPDLEKKYKGFKFTIIHLHNGDEHYDNNLLLIKKN